MALPLGYTPPPRIVLPENQVLCLHKSLYGLKHGSRQWYHRLSYVLLADCFTQSDSNNTFFVKMVGQSFIALLVYVDDIAITSTEGIHH